MQEADIILAQIPQADGRWKTRPVLLLRELPPYQDFLTCGISTQLHQRVAGFDELITDKDDDFENSGLVADSLIRLGFLSVVPRRRIAGKIGQISSSRHERLLQTFSNYLVQDISTSEDESK